MKKICVVTVCRNAINELKVTVGSVKAQQYPFLYYIVIDGDSSDGTKVFLENQTEVINNWMSEPDKGIYDAMNKAIDCCPEDCWVIFLNAGDRFADNSVLNRLSDMLTHSTDMIVGDTIVETDTGSRIQKAYPNAKRSLPACHQSIIVKSSLMKKIKFNINYRVGADFDFFLRVKKLNISIVNFNGVISQVAPEGFSAKNQGILVDDYMRSILENIGRIESLWWIVKNKLKRLLLRLHK